MRKRIKLIGAGWGSNGYYPPDMLSEYGSTAFPVGSKILDTHILANPENRARYQGVSVYDILGESVDEVSFIDDPEDGEGLYAEFKFYDKVVEELGEDRINASQFSIFAAVELSDQMHTIDGQTGYIIEKLLPTPTNSIDAVVYGGAGGKIATIQESAKWCSDGECEMSGGLNIMVINEKMGEETPKSEDNNMELNQALARIEQLEKELEEAKNSVALLTEANENAKSELESTQEELAIERRKVTDFETDKLIAEALAGVEFINKAVEKLVFSDIKRAAIEAGQRRDAVIAENVAIYSSEHDLVVSQKSDEPQHTSESYKYPENGGFSTEKSNADTSSFANLFDKRFGGMQ